MKKTLMLTVFMALSLTNCLCANPVEGKKVGIVTSLSKEGLFCKTWEGTLVRGGVSNGSGTIGGQTRFNVAPGALGEDMVRELTRAMEEGTEVEVVFHRDFIASACTREHEEDVTVTSVRVLEKTSAQQPATQPETNY